MSKRIFYVAVLLTLLLTYGCTPAQTPEQEETVQQEEPTPVPTEPSEPEETRDLRMVVGTFVLNVSYPFVNMPRALGYWEDAGYDVSVEGVGSSTDAMQQMVAGNADLAEIGSTIIVQANVKEDLEVKNVHGTGMVDWGLAVPKDSDIESVEDLDGKSIGVFDLGSSGIPLLDFYLQDNGIDPENDIEKIPVGFGPQASTALNRGDVDAVMLWNSALAQLENLGHEFRIFRMEEWQQMPDFSLATMQSTFEEDRQMVVDIARGMNKAIVFTRANPECVVKLQWKYWPDTKPADVDEETAMQHELNLLNAQMEVAVIRAYEYHGAELYGLATEEEYSNLQQFMVDQGILENTVDPGTFIIQDESYWEEINDFDHEAVRQQAEACDFDFEE